MCHHKLVRLQCRVEYVLCLCGGREGGREGGRDESYTLLSSSIGEGGEVDHSYVSFHMGRSSHQILGNHHTVLSDTPTLCTCA